MTLEEIQSEPMTSVTMSFEAEEEETLELGRASWFCPRCKVWTTEEVRKVCSFCRTLDEDAAKKALIGPLHAQEESTLAKHIFPVYDEDAKGVIYMTVTEDGRVIRVEDY